MASAPRKVGPLNWNIPIVDPAGRPTPEFQREWDSQRRFDDSVAPITTPTQVSNLLDLLGDLPGSLLRRTASGWEIVTGNNGDFLRRVAGSWTTLTTAATVQALLDGISTTQGVLLYYNGTDWVALAPGTAGHLLQTGGAGANPSWTAPPVSNIQTLLDGISTTQGVLLYYNGTDWVALAPGTVGHLIQTGGAGANPSWIAPTPAANIQTLLDGISTTQGVLLYYNGTDWVALATGISGQVLQTNGAAANPSWVTPAGVQTLLDGISTTQGVLLYYNGTDWVALAPGTAGHLLRTGGAGANPSWTSPSAATPLLATTKVAATVYGSSTTAFATKGLRFNPIVDVTVSRYLTMINTANTADVYRMAIYELSGSTGTITAIIDSFDLNPPSVSSPIFDRVLTTPVTLVGNTSYVFALTNTSAASDVTPIATPTGTPVMPLFDNILQRFDTGAYASNTCNLASRNPIVTDTFTLAASVAQRWSILYTS